jgi:hypothetical protein
MVRPMGRPWLRKETCPVKLSYSYVYGLEKFVLLYQSVGKTAANLLFMLERGTRHAARPAVGHAYLTKGSNFTHFPSQSMHY